MPLEHFEVVVIDDGSTDDTRQVVDGFRSLLPIRYAYQSNSGRASARNHGLFLAQGPIVLFLDDDQAADSRLLEEHHDSHRAFPQEHDAVLGYTELASTMAQLPLMHYVTEVGCQLFSYQSLAHGDVLGFRYFQGGRSSFKRIFLLEQGVFNPVLRSGAEDIELGYRLSEAGLQMIYNNRAISHLMHAFDIDTFCRRSYLQGRSNWVLSQLHADQTVHEWTQVEGALDEWQNVLPRFDLLMKMSRDLDRLATERIHANRPLDELTRKLLYRAYGAAFDANRIKGTATIQLEKRQS